MNFDFIITDIMTVRMTDEKKYKENFVEYHPNLISNEIIYRPNGYSTVNFDGKTLHTTPNSVHILPFKNGGKYTVDYDEPDYFIDIFFLTDKPFFKEPFVLNGIKSNRLNSLFNKAFSCFVRKDAGYKFECISILYKIFAEMQKTKYIPDGQFKAIKPAIDYIEAHFLEGKIAAEDISQNCDFSYEYIRKLFVKKFGVSPIKYAINLKINYACELMQSGIYTVSQIAEICGYNDIYFFSRQFKEYMGISPTDFINKYKSSK